MDSDDDKFVEQFALSLIRNWTQQDSELWNEDGSGGKATLTLRLVCANVLSELMLNTLREKSANEKLIVDVLVKSVKGYLEKYSAYGVVEGNSNDFRE